MEENKNYLNKLFLKFRNEDFTKYENELETIMKERKDEYTKLYNNK